MSQKIRIKLKSYDHNLVDKSTVLRSPFVNKKSREQFQLSSFKRLLDIYSSTPKTIDALMKLELPSGVEVEIKV